MYDGARFSVYLLETTIANVHCLPIQAEVEETTGGAFEADDLVYRQLGQIEADRLLGSLLRGLTTLLFHDDTIGSGLDFAYGDLFHFDPRS